MKKIILLMILVLVPFVYGDEAFHFHMDNGTFIVNASYLNDGQYCMYDAFDGLICNSTVATGSVNNTGYFNSITNFTGTLTDTKYCTYDASGTINCTSEGGTDTNETTRMNIIYPEFIANYSYWNDAYSWGDHGLVGYLLTADIAGYYNSESNLTALLDDNYLAAGSLTGYYNSESNLTYLLDDNYHKKGEDLIVGNYDLTLGGGFASGGTTLYSNGSIFMYDDLLLGGYLLSVQDVLTNGSLLPEVNNTYSIGSSSHIWHDGHFAGKMSVGSLNVSTGQSYWGESGESDVNFYIYEDGKIDGETIAWNNTNDRFYISDDLRIQNTLLVEDYVNITESHGAAGTLERLIDLGNASISANSTHLCMVGQSTLCIET